MAGPSTICDEQHELEEKLEEDGGSDVASLHEELLDMSVDEDDGREPAVTRSVSRSKLCVNIITSADRETKDNDDIHLSQLFVTTVATPTGGNGSGSVNFSNPSQPAIPTGSSAGGKTFINDTYEAIRLFKRTAGCAPNLLGGAVCPVAPLGSLYNNGDDRHALCFTKFRFGQKLNIMMSFNPHEMECPCCEGRILSEKNAGNSERRVFILSDQCFPPLALANPVKGQCLKIIRAEGATLWELFSVYYDILRKGQLHVPCASW